MNKRDIKKTALVLGGGGFIGGHLSKRLKDEGFWVRIVDIKEKHEFWNHKDICHEYICGDLRDPKIVSLAMFSPTQQTESNCPNSFDEVYKLAADMGGAGYIFTGENDANVMHNSALINLNTVYEAAKKGVERLFLAFNRNYRLNVRVARFHNIFGPMGTWVGGKEKAPAAMCRKASEAISEIEVWGDGQQTRSFLYIDECVEAVLLFMRQEEFYGPVNIGSEEMVTINQLAQMAIDLSGKNLSIKNIDGPLGVRGRNSDNKLYKEKMGWKPTQPLHIGMEKTYKWINNQLNNLNND